MRFVLSQYRPMKEFPPRRIVCLTEETVETLYLLGEEAPHRRRLRLRGAPGAGAPARSRASRRSPRRISTRLSRWSPIWCWRSPICRPTSLAELIRAGVRARVQPARRRRYLRDDPHAWRPGRRAGAPRRLAIELRNATSQVVAASAHGPRPRVYFEEWDEPMITGIGWVSELIEIAGGVDVFRAAAHAGGGKDRIVSSRSRRRGAPDVIVASGAARKSCGEDSRPRPGWDAIPAVANNRISRSSRR